MAFKPAPGVVDDAQHGLLRETAERLSDVAVQLTQVEKWVATLLDTAGQASANTTELDDHALCEMARSIYRARRRRENFFPANLFGEPAWDILLDIFIHATAGTSLTVTSVCIASAVPTTTALRHIAQLEEMGFVIKQAVSGDARAKSIHMTPSGYEAMRRYILDGVTKGEMPLAT